MSSCVTCMHFSFHCIRYNVFYILGRYEDEFIEHRMNQLQSFVDRVSAHPVLNRYGKSTVLCKLSSFGTFLKKILDDNKFADLKKCFVVIGERRFFLLVTIPWCTRQFRSLDPLPTMHGRAAVDGRKENCGERSVGWGKSIDDHQSTRKGRLWRVPVSPFSLSFIPLPVSRTLINR